MVQIFHVPHLLAAVTLAATFAQGLRADPDASPRNTSPSGSTDNQVLEKLAVFIEQEMRAAGVAGISVAIVEDQRTIFSRGFGYQDLERGILATGETVYRMGSLSKVFTATAIMQLVEQGRVELDAPVSMYVPEFALRSRFGQTPPVTVRQLLTHHGGLPTDLIQGADTQSPQSLAELMIALQSEYLAQVPGEVFQYSNLGYAVLGRLIEKVTGMTYEAYMTAKVLMPAKMEHAAFTPTQAVTSRLAVGYMGGSHCEQYAVRELSAGSLYASVNDVASFLKTVFRDGEPLIGAQGIKEMLQRQNQTSPADLDLSMGLGWQLTHRLTADRNAGPMAWHDGWIWQFSSSMAILPAHKLGIVVATNSDTGKKLVHLIALRALRRLLWEKYGVDRPPWQPPAEPVTLENSDISRYAGKYDTASGILRLDAVDGQLVGNLRGKALTLQPLADGTFVMRKVIGEFLTYQSPELDGLYFQFVEVAQKTILATLDGPQRIPFAYRVEPARIPAQWQRLLGTYINRDASGDFVYVKSVVIVQSGGQLAAAITIGGRYTGDMKSTVALHPAKGVGNGHLAFIEGVGRYRGDVLEVQRTGFGYRLKYQGYYLQKQ